MKNKTVFLIFCVFFLSITALAQKQENITKGIKTSVNLQRTIILETDSQPKEVLINVEKQTARFDIMISTYVTYGKLTIEVYDSNGKKQGNFSVGSQIGSGQEQVNGEIRKSLIEPQAGKWKVKIIPIAANGLIKIKTSSIQ